MLREPGCGLGTLHLVMDCPRAFQFQKAGGTSLAAACLILVDLIGPNLSYSLELGN
jgi:hypothetical protein